jgi:hypothetical protein
MAYHYDVAQRNYVTDFNYYVQADDSNYLNTTQTVSEVPGGFLFCPTTGTNGKMAIMSYDGKSYNPLVLIPQTANASAALAGQTQATYVPSPGLTIDAAGVAYLVSSPSNATQANRYVGFSQVFNFTLPTIGGTSNVVPVSLPCFSPCAAIGNLPIV